MSEAEPVTIVFDVLLEGNETFISMLRLQGVDPQVVIAPAVSTILIIDDDRELHVHHYKVHGDYHISISCLCRDCCEFCSASVLIQ